MQLGWESFNQMTNGIHVLGNLHGCKKELLERVGPIKEIMLKTAEQANFTVLGERFHQFEPHGVTGILLLSESHFSIHTWPEKNFAAVDIFTCGNEGNAEEGFSILCDIMQPEKVDKKLVER